MRIPVNEPIVSESAKALVNDALDTGWISSAGKYVETFEREFAEYVGVSHAVSCSNGTAALHLALLALDLQPGDEILIPDHTIISCALAALYVGAKPVFVDVETKTGNIDPKKIEAKITNKTKAIMVVHLYGHPVNLDPIIEIAKKHKLLLIEDAAEAHGAEYKGKKVGSFGDVATYSFYGNKIVTTGEGGMVVSSNTEIIEKVRLLKDLAHKTGRRFYHEVIGYNYRLTNLQAALGVAHLREIDHYINKKREMATLYTSLLSDIPDLILPSEESYAFNVYWMYNIVLKESASITRSQLMDALQEKGIDSRTYFFPLHQQPVIKQKYDYPSAEYSNSILLSKQGFYVPSGLAITQEQITLVSDALHEIIT